MPFDREICGFGKEHYEEHRASRDEENLLTLRLVQMSLKGDVVAFDLIILYSWSHWMSTLMTWMHPLDFGHDERYTVLTDTILKMWRHRASFKGANNAGVPCRFFTWSITVMRRIYIDWVQRESVQQGRSSWPRPPKKAATTELTGEDAFTYVWAKLLELEKAQGLTDKLRPAYVLQTLRGLTYTEITGVTGVKEQTLQQRVFRAKKTVAA